MEPTSALTPFVRAVRFGYEHLREPVDERILPDGAVHLVFVMPTSDRGAAHAILLGPSAHATQVRLEGSVRHVEIELRAGTTLPLFGIAAADLTDRALSLEEVAAPLADEIVEAMRRAEGRLEVAATEARQRLARRLQGRERPPPLVSAAMARMCGPRRWRVRELADELGVGERRLEQLFRLHVGLSPKRAMRLARFQRVVAHLVGSACGPTDLQNRPPSQAASRSSRETPLRDELASRRAVSWARLALEAGFADQSHLSNDVHAISGLTPVALVAAAGFGFLQD
jgi:methylphosphotriester-DNA--protein-cysteine methyltransferase